MPAFRYRLFAAAALLSAASARAEDPLAAPLPTRTVVTVPVMDGQCDGLRFSPDGKVVAVAEDSTVKLRDAATLKESPVKLDSPRKRAAALAFSFDSRQLAAGGAVVEKVGKEYKRLARAWVWDAVTGKLLVELEGGEGDVDAVAFSPNGKLLITGETDGTVRVWDASTKKERLAIRNPGSPVRGVAFSKDAALVVHAGKDGTIRLADAATGRAAGTLPGHDGGVSHLVVLADGNTLVTAGADRDVRVWDLAARKEFRAFPVAQQVSVTDLSVTADGMRVAVGLFRSVKLFDLTTGKELAELVGHRGQLSAACVAPDGRTLASGDNFDTRLWAAPVKTEGVRVFDTGRVNQFAVTPDGRTFATASDDAPGALGVSTVSVWDAKARTVRLRLDRTEATSLALLPDGKRLAAGVRLDRMGLPSDEYAAAVSDTATGDASWVKTNLAFPLNELVLSPDGAVLVTVDKADTVILRDTKTGGLIDKLTGQAGWNAGLAFSTDGKRLATAANVYKEKQFVGGSLVIWGLDDGLRLVTVADKEFALSQPAFAADGKTLFVCGRPAKTGAKRVLLIFDAATGAKKQMVERPDTLGRFAVSADGKWLAFGVNTDIHLWDQKTLRPVAVLRGHSGEVGHLAFTADGSKLFSTGSSDRTVREWDVKVAARPSKPTP